MGSDDSTGLGSNYMVQDSWENVKENTGNKWHLYHRSEIDEKTDKKTNPL